MSVNIKTVLVVDDSKTSQMIIKSCLEISGYKSSDFVFASDGIEAIDQISKYPIDLAIVDLNMPNMNGKELLVNLKSNIKTIYIPVIILSSIINAKKEKELKELGAAFVLKKPNSPAIFEPVISYF